MRLTLRTLLAYLDDALDPNDTRVIGQKVTESAAAQELIERVRRVTRRRRLTTPDLTAPTEPASDPNTVAEYLDNILPSDEVAEFERVCLESDVHLAEVAACHQILSLILTEPAEVPPTAYRRMYEVFRGREVLPGRRPPSFAAAEPAPPEIRTDSLDEILLMGQRIGQQGSRGNWLATALALLLLLALGTSLYLAHSTGKPSRSPELGKTPVPLATEPGQAAAPKLQQAAQEPASPLPAPSERVWDLPLGLHLQLAGTLATRPAYPDGLFLALGEIQPHAAVPAQPPERPAPAVQVPRAQPPEKGPEVLARYPASSFKEALTLRQIAPDSFVLLTPDAPVYAGDTLVTLPGYRGVLEVEGRHRLELTGNLPEMSLNNLLDTSVTLHQASEQFLDVTVHRGRVVISRRPEKELDIRLRCAGQEWQIKLIQPTSRIGVETIRSVDRRQRTRWIPAVRFAVLTSGGEVLVKRTHKHERIAPGYLIPWDSSLPAEPAPPLELREPVTWILQPLRAPDEIRSTLAAFHRRIVDKLTSKGQPLFPAEKETGWLRIALEEAITQGKPLERRQALFSSACIGHLRPLIEAFDSPRIEVRMDAIVSLWYFLALREDNDRPLREALARADYSSDEIGLLLELLRGFPEADPTVYDWLLRQMNHDRLIVRELAFLNLRFLVPPGQKLPAYDPTAAAEQRARAIETLRDRLVGK